MENYCRSRCGTQAKYYSSPLLSKNSSLLYRCWVVQCAKILFSKTALFYLVFHNESTHLNLLAKTPKLILSPDCKDTEVPLSFDPLTKVPYLDVSVTVNTGTERDWLWK